MRNVTYIACLLMVVFCISCGSDGTVESPEPQQSSVSGQLEVDSSIIEIDVNLSEFDSRVSATIDEEDGTVYLSLHFSMPFMDREYSNDNTCELDVSKIPTDKSNVTYPVEDLDAALTITYDLNIYREGITEKENTEGSLEITELSISEIPWESCSINKEIGYVRGTLSMQSTYYLLKSAWQNADGPYPFDIFLNSSFEAPVLFTNCII